RLPGMFAAVEQRGVRGLRKVEQIGRFEHGAKLSTPFHKFNHVCGEAVEKFPNARGGFDSAVWGLGFLGYLGFEPWSFADGKAFAKKQALHQIGFLPFTESLNLWT